MFTVSFIGPDGSGKTTLARHMEDYLPVKTKYMYMGVSLESSNIMLPTSRLKLVLRRLLKRPSDTVGPRDPSSLKQRSKNPIKQALRFVKQSVRLLNQVAEELFRQFVISWYRFRGYIVILDRDFFADYYTYDIVSEGPRPLLRRIHGFILKTFYRKPDLALYLDVSGEVMFARKGEGTVELLEQRRADYKRLADVLPRFDTVDGNQPLDVVIADVQKRIMQFHGEKKQKKQANDKPHVVLVGFDCSTALQSARVLKSYRIPTLGIAKNLSHFACRTNSCERIIKSSTADETLIDTLCAIGPGLMQKAVIMPCTDLSVMLVSKHRTRLENWYHIPLPSHDTIEILMDKVRFAELAEKHGLPIPKTIALSSQTDVEEACQNLRFPCMLKPGIKTTQWESNTKKKVVEVGNVDELKAAFKQYSKFSDLLLVQEKIMGDSQEFTCNAYYQSGSKPIAYFTSQKIRKWPSVGGTGCISVEAENQLVVDECHKLHSLFDYRGFGYLEMKYDERDKRFLMIESNPGRPTGRSTSAEPSGVELLRAMYCDAIGTEVPSQTTQRPIRGRKWIYIRRDLISATYSWWHGKQSFSSIVKSWRGPKKFAVLSLRDPVPFLAECLGAARKVVRRVIGK